MSMSGGDMFLTREQMWQVCGIDAAYSLRFREFESWKGFLLELRRETMARVAILRKGQTLTLDTCAKLVPSYNGTSFAQLYWYYDGDNEYLYILEGLKIKLEETIKYGEVEAERRCHDLQLQCSLELDQREATVVPVMSATDPVFSGRKAWRGGMNRHQKLH